MDQEILSNQISIVISFLKIPQIYKKFFQRNKIGAVLALHQKNTNHYVDFGEL